MTLQGVREGDIVQCDIRGDRFLAFAAHRGERRGELWVKPISTCRPNPRIVTARQVVEHWRKRKARAA